MLSKEQSLVAVKEKIEALEQQIVALKEGKVLTVEKAKNKILQMQLKVKSDSMDLLAIEADNDVAKLQLDRQEKFRSNRPVFNCQPIVLVLVLVLAKLTSKSKPALEKGAIFCGRLGEVIYL